MEAQVFCTISSNDLAQNMYTIPSNDLAQNIYTIPYNDLAQNIYTILSNDLTQNIYTILSNDLAQNICAILSNDLAQNICTILSNDLTQNIYTILSNDLAQNICAILSNDLAQNICAILSNDLAQNIVPGHSQSLHSKQFLPQYSLFHSIFIPTNTCRICSKLLEWIEYTNCCSSPEHLFLLTCPEHLCLFRKLRNQSKDKQGMDLRVEASPAGEGCASLVVSTQHADVYFEYVDGKLYILYYFFEYSY